MSGKNGTLPRTRNPTEGLVQVSRMEGKSEDHRLAVEYQVHPTILPRTPGDDADGQKGWGFHCQVPSNIKSHKQAP